MIVSLAIGIPVAIALLFWWMSAATDRRNRRSMQRYGSALDVLGDVSRRSEAGAPVPLPAAEDVARPHIDFETASPIQEDPSESVGFRPRLDPPRVATGEMQHLPLFDDLQPQLEASEGFHDASATAAALGRMVARSRFNREHGITAENVRVTDAESRVHLSVPTGDLMRFGTDDVIVDDDVPLEDDAVGGRHFFGVRRGGDLRVGPPRGTRRRHQIVLAAVLAALALGGVLFVTLGSTPRQIAGQHAPTTTTTGRSPGSTSTTGPSVPPKILTPTTTTATLVTYHVPAANYTLVFTSTGACWLGAQRRVNGSYLWMDTLSAGGTTSYRASGTRVIRLGAPRAISITLNGIPIALPTNLVVPYDIKLELSTS